MDTGYVTAAAALTGSIVGSLTSLATTYLTQHAQRYRDRVEKDAARREAIYSDFIDEASKLYVQGFSEANEDLKSMALIGALLNRMRLFSSPAVLVAAEQVLATIVAVNQGPSYTFSTIDEARAQKDLHSLKVFSDACRRELGDIT